MKKNKSLLLYIIVGFMVLFIGTITTSSYAQENSLKEIIIVFKERVKLPEVYNFLKSYSLKPINAFKYNEDTTFLVRFKDDNNITVKLSDIKKDRRVDVCLPNFKMHLKSNTLDEILEDNKDVFNNYLTYTSNLNFDSEDEVTIVYLDSGFDIPDFVKENSHRYKIGLESGEGYGFDLINSFEPPDPSEYNSVENWEKAFRDWTSKVDTTPEDNVGHGTFGASLGLAYAPNCRILPIKITDKHDNFGIYPFIKAIKLVNHLMETEKVGSKVILNMSLSSLADKSWKSEGEEYNLLDFKDWFNQSLFKPLRNKDVVMLAAGHSEGQDLSKSIFPAFLDGVMMIERSEFRDKSSVEADLFAPGFIYSSTGGSKVERKNGSSISTFITSAVTADILRVNPNLNKEQLKIVLRSNTPRTGILKLAVGEDKISSLANKFKDLRSEFSEEDFNKKKIGSLYKKIINELNKVNYRTTLNESIINSYKKSLQEELSFINESDNYEKEKLFSYQLSNEIINSIQRNKLNPTGAIRTGTIYSSLKLIKLGVQEKNLDSINKGFKKLIYDTNYQNHYNKNLYKMKTEILNSVQNSDTAVEKEPKAIIEELVNEVVITPTTSSKSQDSNLENEINFVPPEKSKSSGNLTGESTSGTLLF